MSDSDKEEIKQNLDNEESTNSELKPTALSLLDQELVESWRNEQISLRKKLILYDTEPWQLNKSVYKTSDDTDQDTNNDEPIFSNEHLRYVAGLDISFVKGNDIACSGLFVFDLADNMSLVYQDIDKDLIEMKQPYVPGFLAYREAPFLLSKLEKLRVEKPHLYPHCIFIDGNGLLHVNKFGAACHIGVLCDTPTIGVSKQLFQVFGLEKNQQHKDKIKENLKKAGDYFELRTNETDADLLGYCYRPTDKSTNPIYVSIGHKISWQTCLWILRLVITKYRIPEPIRMADITTRDYLAKCKLLNSSPKKQVKKTKTSNDSDSN